MTYSVSTIEHFKIQATDTRFGFLRDLYFDDQSYSIRYLIVDLGGWLSAQSVLIRPGHVRSLKYSDKTVVVDLTREQMIRCPGTETDQPVSRQNEAQVIEQYRWRDYWPGAPPWQATFFFSEGEAGLQRPSDKRRGDRHLRSSNEVIGYSVAARDGGLGSINDILFQDADWQIQGFVISTAPLWFGKKVMLPPKTIHSIVWSEKQVRVDCSREQIKQSMPYDSASA